MLEKEFKVPVPPSGQYVYYPGTSEVPEHSEQKLVTDAPRSGTHVVGVEFTKERVGEHRESHGPAKLYVDDAVAAEDEIRTMSGHFCITGEGLCIGYDSGDSVSEDYRPRFDFAGGRIVKVVSDVADDAYIDVERHVAAAMKRD